MRGQETDAAPAHAPHISHTPSDHSEGSSQQGPQESRGNKEQLSLVYRKAPTVHNSQSEALCPQITAESNEKPRLKGNTDFAQSSQELSWVSQHPAPTCRSGDLPRPSVSPSENKSAWVEGQVLN